VIFHFWTNYLKFTDWNNNELPETIEEILSKLDFGGIKISLQEENIEDKINEICNKLKEVEQE